MTPAPETLWYWLADYYALATCVLLAAAPALVAIGQPARRLAVGGCTLGGLVGLLALSLIPSWPKASLHWTRETSVPTVPTPISSTSLPVAPEAIPSAPPARKDEAAPGRVERQAAVALPINDSRSRATAWPSMLVGAFFAAACAMLAWLAIGRRRLALLRRRSRPAPEAMCALLARVVGDDAAPPELRVSDSLRQPVAAGLRRPSILLPEWFLDEPEGRLEAALAHEWSHIRNGDLRLIALSRVLLPVLFAHPAYWWLRGRIQDDQEAVADACAAAVEGRVNYAEGLLSWASNAPERSWIAAGGAVALFERTSQLKRRIVMLLGDSHVETTCPKSWRTAARIATAAAVAAASFVTLRPKAAGADAPGPTAIAVVRTEEPRASDVTSRLLDPDGKPFAGAKVYLSTSNAWLKSDPTTPVLIGTTSADGAFRRPRRAEWDGKRMSQVVLTAEGFGPALVDPAAKDDEESFMLARDDVPIQGRVLDVDGRPVAGAKATLVGVLWHPSGKLDQWIDALKEGHAALNAQFGLRGWVNNDVPTLIPPVVADAAGRFTIRGVGRERIASLLIEGPGGATTVEYVVTRPMPALKIPDALRQFFGDAINCYGADFDLMLGPELVAVGTVTDKDTGKPVAGATVGTSDFFGNPMRRLKTTTDAQGRYRLAGMPPRPRNNDEHQLLVEPADGVPYLPTFKALAAGGRTKPVVVDFQLKRGVRARGRVVDKSTGKGVRARLSYYVLAGNPNRKDYPRYGTIRAGGPYATDEEGNFDLIVMPGPGVLGARVGDEHYRLGVGVESIKGLQEKDDVHGFISADPQDLVANNFHTVLGIDPKPEEETITCEIALDRGRSVKGFVVGPDGAPLVGVRMEGLQDRLRIWSDKPMPSAEFLVEGLGEGATRDLLAYHEAKKLAGALVLKPGDVGPITMKLEPCGTVVGRLVEGGRPLAGIEMSCPPSYEDTKHESGSLPGGFRTDDNGRFRAEGLVPGRKYTLQVLAGPRRVTGRTVDVAKDVVVAGGETRDLGDIQVQMDD
jgi:beta-lactamase regulating signal transducer with metallopeptidase domain/protocatechuate 3,4-dioxygenase beta subunit